MNHDDQRKHRSDPACDPGLFDELACKAYGIQKQAEYNAKQAKLLATARQGYDGARKAYTDARRKADPMVRDEWGKLAKILKDVRCRLAEHEAERLDQAFAHIVERLENCEGACRCCSDDDDRGWDHLVRGCDPDDVDGHIATITRETAAATVCFNDLMAEATVPWPPPDPAAAPAAQPTAQPSAQPADAPAADPPQAKLPARVAAVVKEVDDLIEDAADSKSEPDRLYVRALVARRHIETIWRGFVTVNDYMDCLCRALTRMIRGHAAISTLTRIAAVEACYRRAWADACKRYEEKTVDEVLAEYYRICARDEDDDDDDCDGEDGDGEDGDGEDGDDDRPGRGRDDRRRPGRGDGDEPGGGRGDGQRGRRRPEPPPAAEADEPEEIEVLDIEIVEDEEAAPEPAYGRAGPGRGSRRRPHRDDRGRYRAP